MNEGNVLDLLDFSDFEGKSGSGEKPLIFEEFLKEKVEDNLNIFDDNKGGEAISEDEGGDSDDLSINNSENYKDTLLELMDNGIIDKFDVIETDDGEISLNDLDKLDKGMFSQLISNYISEVKNERVNLGEMSEMAKRVVELDRQGIDISNVLEAYSNSAGLVKDIDLSNEDNQKRIVLDYLTQYKGYSDKDSIKLLKSYQAEGTLLEEAELAKKDIEERFLEYTKELEKEHQKAKADFENYVNEQKTTYTEEMNKLGLEKAYGKKVVDLLTSYNEIDGKTYNELDVLYAKLKKNPAKMAKLALYMFDEEKFMQLVNKEKEKEVATSIFKKIRLSASSKKAVGNNLSQLANKGKDNLVVL